MVTDELSLRAAAMQSVGFNSAEIFTETARIGGRVLVVDDRENSTAPHPPGPVARLRDRDHRRSGPCDQLRRDRDLDLLIASLTLKNGDGLRLCSQIKAIDRMRQTPVLLITDVDETQRLMRALDIGVNDYIIRPIDVNELRARVRTQLRRKLYAERLRDMVSSAVELAITDPLTGLYNRRYLDAHLKSVVARAVATAKPVCVLLFDIDHFKGINDTYGHDAGDDVLRDFSDRLRRRRARHRPRLALWWRGVRAGHARDRSAFAGTVAERLRRDVEMVAFTTKSGASLPVTVSIGLADGRARPTPPDTLIKRADRALYAAKGAGRNRVVASAA